LWLILPPLSSALMQQACGGSTPPGPVVLKGGRRDRPLRDLRRVGDRVQPGVPGRRISKISPPARPDGIHDYDAGIKAGMDFDYILPPELISALQSQVERIR
jgi:hypothetical protein